MPFTDLQRRPAAAMLFVIASIPSSVLFAQTATPTPTPTSGTVASTPPATAATTVPQPVPMNRGVVVLDPAHGGVDSGSRISDTLVEKDVTLAFAFKLRSLLTSRGFTVVMTRDSDAAFEANSPSTPLSLDDRAGIANHQRPVACLLLHATSAGSGVHLYTSDIAPTAGEPALQPWLTAQAAWVGESGKLERQIATALDRSRVVLASGNAAVRPVDSLTCPAVVVELAPSGDDPATITDTSYQQKVSEAIAGAMVFWQHQAQAPVRILPVPPPAAPAASAAATESNP
ncbi:N-acetylmuramoyl-L-alanine amidase [Bryocella elongata]|uniref:N-acetylmuramoyl-L-alanine amidase n=1 Tax=Bryocella elongata TaxID=863522 RepID=A0A1H5U3P7_9BACT|nr:N-acetylmuramoyl-L-alanine amidase [Bryocella elongata]SEF68907.1 N-acetylmuramoyl-L-alanine amidase [Bryocella elongata]